MLHCNRSRPGQGRGHFQTGIPDGVHEVRFILVLEDGQEAPERVGKEANIQRDFVTSDRMLPYPHTLCGRVGVCLHEHLTKHS